MIEIKKKIKDEEFTLIFDDDYEKYLEGYNNISIHKSGKDYYKVRVTKNLGNKKYRQYVFSRIIMGIENNPKLIVDHINHNPLDNRRENLRICTKTENNWNRLKYNCSSKGSTPYKGVYLHQGYTEGIKKYRATIGYNNNIIYIGTFNTPEEGALAYNKKAIELFGEYAYLNEINY